MEGQCHKDQKEETDTVKTYLSSNQEEAVNDLESLRCMAQQELHNLEEERKQLELERRRQQDEFHLELRKLEEERKQLEMERNRQHDVFKLQQEEFERQKETWRQELEALRTEHRKQEKYENGKQATLLSIVKERPNKPQLNNEETQSSQSPAFSWDTSQTGMLCVVCGDMANGMHYNALTCEGCKIFFRRHAKKKDSPKKNGQHVDAKDCMIDPVMRKQCGYCRMKKCLLVGMETGRLWDKQRCKTRKTIKKCMKMKTEAEAGWEDTKPEQKPTSSESIIIPSSSSEDASSWLPGSAPWTPSSTDAAPSLSSSESMPSSSTSFERISPTKSGAGSQPSSSSLPVPHLSDAHRDLLKQMEEILDKSSAAALSAYKTTTTLEKIKALDIAKSNGPVSMETCQENPASSVAQPDVQSFEDPPPPGDHDDVQENAKTGAFPGAVNDAMNAHILESILIGVKIVILFIKSFPVCRELSLEDQSQLVKEVFMEYAAIEGVRHYYPQKQSFKLITVPGGEDICSSVSKQAGFSTKLFSHCQIFSEEMKALQLTKQEHATLLALRVLTPERSVLSDAAKKMLTPHSNKLIEAFAASVCVNHPEEPQFFSKVQAALTKLFTITEGYRDQFMQFKIQGKSIPPLLMEVLRIEDMSQHF